MALRQQLLRLAGRAVEQRLNADTSDEVGFLLPCSCGGEAHFAGRGPKQFQRVLGPLRLERAYYHCPACGRGYFPRDRQLGIENTSLFPALTRMTATVGAMVSFQEGGVSGDFIHTLVEIVISPLAHPSEGGLPYPNSVALTHSSDLHTMQETGIAIEARSLRFCFGRAEKEWP